HDTDRRRLGLVSESHDFMARPKTDTTLDGPKSSPLDGRERLPMRDFSLRSVLLSSLDLSDAPSVRSVPMIILAISRSEPGVRPYPSPAFTSKRPILKSTAHGYAPPRGE